MNFESSDAELTHSSTSGSGDSRVDYAHRKNRKQKGAFSFLIIFIKI